MTHAEQRSETTARRARATERSPRVRLVLDNGRAQGLTTGPKTKRISGRIQAQLYEAAAGSTGLEGSDLLEYALVELALDNRFRETWEALQGSVSRDIDLEFFIISEPVFAAPNPSVVVDALQQLVPQGQLLFYRQLD